nr:hypothetical protein HmN_001002200 [Hymenolepis microstoma]
MPLRNVMIACFLLDAGFKAISKAPTPDGGSALYSAVSAQLSTAAPCLPPPHTPFSPTSTRSIPTHCLSSWAHDAHGDRRLSEPSSSSPTSSTSSFQSSACLPLLVLPNRDGPDRACGTKAFTKQEQKEGGDGGGSVGGGVGDDVDVDDDDDDDNDDVVDESANQLSRSQLEQYDCNTRFTLTLLIKVSLGEDNTVKLGC